MQRAILLLALLGVAGCSDMFADTRPVQQAGADQPAQLAADAAAPSVRDDEPFTCKGHQPEPAALPQLPTGSSATTGRLEIKCEVELAPVAPPVPTAAAMAAQPSVLHAEPTVIKAASKESPLDRKCRFVAQDATLSAVAVALSDATGLSAVVNPTMSLAPVSVVMPSASVKQFLDALRVEGYRYRWTSAEKEIRLGFKDEPRDTDREPRRERIINVSPRAPARQFGQAVCQLLTPRGHLEVVGHRVFVTDVPEVLARAELLARSLDGEEVGGITSDQWNRLYDAFTRSTQTYDTTVKARKLIEDALDATDERIRRDELQQADSLLMDLKPPDSRAPVHKATQSEPPARPAPAEPDPTAIQF